MYIYGYFIPQSLVVDVIAVFEFCGDSVFVSGQGTDTQKCSLNIKVIISGIFFYYALFFFIKLTKIVKEKQLNL